MSKLILAMIAMAGLGVAAAQAPAPKQNEVGSVTQQAMQQQEFAGEQAKVQKTPKPKVTDKQKAAEVQGTTTQAIKQDGSK